DQLSGRPGGARGRARRRAGARVGVAVRRARPRGVEPAGGVHAAEPDRGRPRPGARRRRPDRPPGRRRGLPAAVAAAQPLRRRGHAAARGDVDLPRRGGPAHSLRHRGGGLRGRRQVDDRAAAARAAQPLARHPPGGAGDHRRVPAAQRGAGAARAARAQGLPRVLRPPRAAAVRGGGEVGRRGGARPGVLPPDLRHRPRRADGGAPARRPHRRGPQRAAARPLPRRRGGHVGAGGQRLLRRLRLRRRTPRGHPALVRRALPAAAADGVRRPHVVLPPLRDAHRRPGPGAGHGDLAGDQRAEPRAQHRAHPRARHPGADQGRRPRGAPGAAAEAL
ncbi:MAG: Pantothenate kinase, partial [uncultured Quadrisphaera sp.]